jgi:beta-lactam-binding protein with PASTA domain
MPEQYVCPHCGSSKIGKESEDDEDYFCNACFEFFPEPFLIGEKIISEIKVDNKIIAGKIKKEAMDMGNRYKLDIDREKIRVLASDKTIPEISEATGYKVSSIRSACRAMGIKPKIAHHYKPRKSSNNVEKHPSPPSKSVSDVTVLDMAIAERDQCQERVFVLNKVIELLS